jgi:hypothetical protein
MDRKQRLFRLIETHVNDYNKGGMEGFYGVGTKLKVKDINYITTTKSLLIDSTLTVGDIVDEFSLYPEVAENFLYNAAIYFFSSDIQFSFTIKIDV